MIFAALVMTVMAAAQTVESSKLLENTYVTILGGGTTTGAFGQVPTPFFWDGAKAVVNGVRPFAALEVGKNITPVVGVSLEGVGFFGTTTSATFFDESALLGNGKVNFSNWFGGYKGYPRRVEVVGVLGMGWGHDYVGNGQTWTSTTDAAGLERVVGTNVYNDNVINTDKNYVVYNAGAELNINLGKERAWQITVRPGVMWFNKYTAKNYQSLPRFRDDARANIQIGATYKFGSKRTGSHNFVLCPYSVTKADYDALKAELDRAKNREPEVVTKEVEKVVEKEVVKVEVKYSVLPLTVKFKIGSANLNAAAKESISDYVDMIPENSQVIIVGSADTKTGSASRNDTLAKQRAEVVAAELRKNGVKNIVTKSALDVDDNPAQSRVAIVEVSE